MRAAVVREYGSPPVAGDFREPDPAAGEVLAVLAGGLNPIDLRIASGALPRDRPELPYVPGSEGVGRRPDGSRVYFRATVRPHGAFAERTVVPEGAVIPLPDGVDDALAVACGTAGLAGWLAVERGSLQRGETVLVLGATGVVGAFAVQAAKLLGAGRVVAAGRNEAALRRASELGADATVALDSADDLTAAFREAAGGDVHVVVDPVWGEPAVAAIRALAPGGRLVQLGQSAGAEATLASADIRFKQVEIRGYTNFALSPEQQRAAYERVVGHAAAGELTVEVEHVPLDRVGEAWQRQAASPGRKLVIVP